MSFVPLKNYASDKVVVTFRGLIIMGTAPGTFVSVERAVDTFTKQVGSDGSVARARSADKSGSVTLTLMATSPSNDQLSQVAKEDEEFGTGVGPIMVKDLLGNTLCASQFAWIRKPPTVEFGGEVGDREWAIDCDRLEMLAGGAL